MKKEISPENTHLPAAYSLLVRKPLIKFMESRNMAYF